MALEPEFWAALAGIAAKHGQTLSALVAQTDAARNPARPLASALRVLALQRSCDRELVKGQSGTFTGPALTRR